MESIDEVGVAIGTETLDPDEYAELTEDILDAFAEQISLEMLQVALNMISKEQKEIELSYQIDEGFEELKIPEFDPSQFSYIPAKKYGLDWVDNFDVDVITANAENNPRNSVDEGVFCPQRKTVGISENESIVMAYSDLCLFNKDHRKLKIWEEKETESFSVKHIETIFDESDWSDLNIEKVLQKVQEADNEM